MEIKDESLKSIMIMLVAMKGLLDVYGITQEQLLAASRIKGVDDLAKKLLDGVLEIDREFTLKELTKVPMQEIDSFDVHREA